jgi:hypothetical protein
MKDDPKHSPEENEDQDHRKENPDSHLDRREFLRLSTAASLGLATGALGLPRLVSAGSNETSRVVVVTDEQASIGSAIQPEIVRIMIDAGVQALTDAATPQDAWLMLFPNLAQDLSIGFKTSHLYTLSSSHPEVAFPLADSLASTPAGGSNYPLNQMLIWDRLDYELAASGFELNTGTTGVRCFGTDNPVAGYHPEPMLVIDSWQLVSRCYTDYSDNLINLCLLKNHTLAGVSHSLKSHYGTVHNPEGLHAGYCDPYVPALNAALFDTYGPRQKLCICDGIYGVTSGGPISPWQINPNMIILSQDPVALDAICREILIENGCTSTWMSYHIDSASLYYNLGNSNLADIERVDVLNPSTGVRPNPGSARPGQISLGANYPEPFNASTSIPLELDRTTSVEALIYDVRGRAVSTLYKGTLSPGRHVLSWNGTGKADVPVPSGRYLVRVKAADTYHTRQITLLK